MNLIIRSDNCLEKYERVHFDNSDAFFEFFQECIDESVDRARSLNIRNRDDAIKFYGYHHYSREKDNACSHVKSHLGLRKNFDSYEIFVPENFEKAKEKYGIKNNLIGDEKLAVVGWGVNLMQFRSGSRYKIKDKNPVTRLVKTYLGYKNSDFFKNNSIYRPLGNLSMPLCPFEVPVAGVLVGFRDEVIIS